MNDDEVIANLGRVTKHLVQETERLQAERDALQATLDQVRTMAEDYAKYDPIVREILKVLDA
jgi:ABC-type transporter Mla subunit MlaD